MTRVLAMVAVVGLAALLHGGSAVAAQKRPAWQGDVDRLFAAWDRRDSPGCAVAIYRDGRILYERGYGMADLEHDVPITPATVFYAGSVSKQFTAFAAALAIQQGHLGLDDSIRKYVPELPAYADAITVRHLIHHTSGLRDFYTLLSIAGRRQDALYDNASILRLAARQKGLNFPPGDDYLYSNTGYALLATVAGRAAKTTFGELTRSQIFAPLGMTASEFGDDAGRLVKARAWGYTWGARGEPRLDTPGGERVGAGGLFTTVRDLLRWDENFYTGTVGGKPLIAQVQTPGTLNGGKPLTYAWGLQVARYRGQRVIEHSGALGGYRAHLSRFPDQHVSVAVLCNLASITPGPLVQRIADLVLADRLAKPTPAAAAPSEPPGAAQAGDSPRRDGRSMGSWEHAAGAYVSDEIDAVFRITSRDGRLLLQREDDAEPQPLQAAGDGVFRFRTMTIRFEPGRDGRVGALVVDAGRVRNIRFERVQP
jgi:CubicO group peptidase (beta-lactamase class C family)